MKRSIRLLSLAVVGLTACGDHQPTAVDSLAPGDAAALSTAAQATTTTRVVPFGPTIPCAGGIRIQGTIHIRETTDGAGGFHQVRLVVLKDFTARNVADGTMYRVSGAEVFVTQTRPGGHPHVFVHTGNLVFHPENGGRPIIAHHSIRLVRDASGEVRVDDHQWSCIVQGDRTVTHHSVPGRAPDRGKRLTPGRETASRPGVLSCLEP